MLEEEQILKVLKKYGFYSLNRAPYLYRDENRLGVCFSWPNNHYGNLERVLFFSKEEEIEEEVFKYWWYLNNKNKYNIEVEFDDYEKLDPKVFYKFKNTFLDITLMKNFEQEKDLIRDEEFLVEKKQYKRTAKILIMLLKEKFKEQNNIYFKVLGLYKELKDLKDEYQNKLNQNNKMAIEDCEILEDEEVVTNFVDVLNDKLSILEEIPELKSFIEKLVEYLKEMDLSEVHFQNLYLLEQYPKDISDLKNRIIILDESFKGKKKRLNQKNNIGENLRDVNQILENTKVNIKGYLEEKREEVQKKYAKCFNIALKELGDYLVTLDNLELSLPSRVEQKEDYSNFDKQKFSLDLQKEYEKLSKLEKDACHVAASFLSDCLNYLMNIENFESLSIKDIIKKLTLEKKIEIFEEAFNFLDNYLNAKYRVKYMSGLKMTSFEVFMESLRETLHVLKGIRIRCKDGFVGYYKNKEDGIIFLNLKNFSYLNQEESYIFYGNSDICLYYSPIQIVKSLDIMNYEELVIKNKESYFFLKDSVLLQDNANSRIVKKYEKELLETNNIQIVKKMKELNKCRYYEVVLAKKEDNIYE